MTVHGYVRTSQPPKRRRGVPANTALGLESQVEAIRSAYPGAVIHTDKYQSGRRVNRPALRAMIQALAPDDLVVVVRLDRLARSFRLAMALELEIEDLAHARLVSLAGEGTSADGPPDPYAVFARRIHWAAAELQAVQAAATTKDALAVRRRAGLPSTGSAPWGWQIRNGKLIRHAGEQKTLTLAREWLGKCRSKPIPGELAGYLTRRGVTNRAGRPITRDTCGRIIAQLQLHAANNAKGAGR